MAKILSVGAFVFTPAGDVDKGALEGKRLKNASPNSHPR